MAVGRGTGPPVSMSLTSLECRRDGSSVCSPDELNVQWKDSAGGDASTSHLSCSVSCFRAPKSSSRSTAQTGASGIVRSGRIVVRSGERNAHLLAKVHADGDCFGWWFGGGKGIEFLWSNL